jgi:endonuclease/exonuclease/phosphatase family metal-dependent hydrolase
MHMNVRLATYNLFEGAGGAYNRLVEFVRTKELDVVCLQEANGWQDNDFARLKDFTDKILFAAYAYGNSNTEFKLATVSKHAINKQTLHAEAFWHAALETRLMLGDHEVAVVNLHLDPWKEESRESELNRLLAALEPGRPTIITGDFNSLSRQDNYSPELLDKLRAAGISKFGMQQLEFRVIDRILQAGFVDAAALAGKMETTVPSAFNTDQDHEVPVRVDYVFVSPDLAPLVAGVECVKTDLTDAISDHYPLIVTFNLDAGQQPAQAQPAAAPADSAPIPAAQPAAPPEPPQQPKEPVVPWTPPEDPTPPTAPAPPAPQSQPTPPAPPIPPQPADGEVIMWRHSEDK